MHTILIVEDERDISSLIANRLDANLYTIDSAYDGREAQSKIVSQKYDLITLDVMLPHINGWELATLIRNYSKETLIIMVTALDTHEFKERGYSLGIDDYIAKPFSPKELALKIQALLARRYELQNSSIINKSVLSYNKGVREFRIQANQIVLTPSEHTILETLFESSKRLFSREELAQIIYDNGYGDIDIRGIDSHIAHIRKKLSIYSDKEIIQTIRGAGYKLHED